MNLVIILIVAVAVIVGLRSTVRHFQHKSSCCGGGSAPKSRKKKLTHVVAKKTFVVEGMHCEHCKSRVEGAVNELYGAAAVVDLKRGVAEVSYAEPMEDSVIRERIEKAGYTVTEIRD